MTRSRAIVTAVVFVGWMSTAQAHFKLNVPASLSDQNASGGPQKPAPCGQDDGNPAFVLTNIVTPFEPGSMVTITLQETVFHPGHYRVSLAQDMASLPADPVVTPGASQCGSTAIDPNPTLPVIADGLLVHTQAFVGAQTVQVQLPAGMECRNCVLQVLEFMSSHPAPCFYHHCATVDISSNAPDAGVIPGDDAGTTEPPPPAGMAGGCCSANRNDSVAGSLLGVLIVGLLVRRRR